MVQKVVVLGREELNLFPKEGKACNKPEFNFLLSNLIQGQKSTVPS